MDHKLTLQALASHRTEDLADWLVDFVGEPPLRDPMAPEHVVVPSRGTERWLTMRLAQRSTHGIAMNFRFLFPGKAVRRLVDQILLPDGERDFDAEALEDDPWDPARLVWSVLQELPDCLGDETFRPLRQYLAADAPVAPPQVGAAPVGRREYELSRRIAALFDQYASYRPDWVVAWQAPGHRPPTIRGWQPDMEWQPRLFARIARAIGRPHPTARIQQVIERLRAGVSLAGLPERLAVFGISNVPPIFLDLLAALGDRMPVRLFIVTPVGGYFGDLPGRREIRRLVRRFPDTSADDLHIFERNHPLLQSMGKVARDFNERLCQSSLDVLEGAPDPDPGASMLRRIQSDLYHLICRQPPPPDEADRDPRADAPVRVDRLDDSLQFHACHGRIRQVEILRDCLLRLMRDHADIEPRDVAVLCPDIDGYAPLIDAIFSDGNARGGAAPGMAAPGAEAQGAGFDPIPFNIADRSPRGNNLVAQALAAILALPGSRVTASSLLDLLDIEPVRRRFGLGPEDLEWIRGWACEGGVRWGVDASHRRSVLQLDVGDRTEEAATCSWEFALDRLLLGVAIASGDGAVVNLGLREVLPCDGIEGGRSRVLGRFARFCETLFEARRFLSAHGHASPGQWRERIEDLLDVFLDVPEAQFACKRRVLEAFLAIEASAEQLGRDLDLDSVQTLLDAELETASGGTGLLAGGVNFCALVPMRTLPFKVVCMLGMDDGAFPRQQPRSGFDLLGRDPRPGDRDARDDDRYLFLEALLAARDHLLVFWNGRSIRDNEALPPSVPVGELLDLVARTFALPAQGPAARGHGRVLQPEELRCRMVTEHPLQPFGVEVFSVRTGKPRGFDARALRGARALQTRARSTGDVGGKFPAPLPREDRSPWIVSVDHLVRFMEHPVKHLLQRRLGMQLEKRDDELQDRESFEFDSLEEWKFGDEYLQVLLAEDGGKWEGVQRRFELQGRLPPGNLARGVLKRVKDEAEALFEAIPQNADPRSPRLRDRDIDLRVGPLVVQGTLDDLRESGQLIVQYSKIKPKRLLSAWVRHLLACARSDDFPGTTWLVGRSDRTGPVPDGLVVFGEPPGAREKTRRERAVACLSQVAAWYAWGWHRPLLLLPAASFAYWKAHEGAIGDAKGPEAADRAGRAEAESCWRTDPYAGFDSEDLDPWLRWVLGDAEPWAALRDGLAPDLPVPLEPGFRPEELARTVWGLVANTTPLPVQKAKRVRAAATATAEEESP